jgi:hypothetical protein
MPALKPAADLTAKTTDELRAEFRKYRTAALYAMSSEDFAAEVKSLAGRNPSPAAWTEAARTVPCECERCRGTGEYGWGPVVNGKVTHRGPCYRCEGKGWQGYQDFRRNRAYDEYQISCMAKAMFNGAEVGD